MRWFYVITVAVGILLGVSPFMLLPETDVSKLQGKVADPLPAGAQAGAEPGEHEMVVIFDVYGSKIKTLDPAVAGDVASATLQANVYESLYGYHYLKRPPEIVPLLAESMPEVSADGLTYTIKIKKGVQYHRNECFGVKPDGTPKTRELVAEDFVLGFKRIADSHISTELAFAFIEDKVAGLTEYRARTESYAKGDMSRYQKERIDGVKALDDHTLQIKLKGPFPQLIYVLAMPNFVPIPHEVVSYYLSRRARPSPEILHDYQAAVGTGPYYIETFADGGTIRLRRNNEFRPDYYPAEGEPSDKAAGLLDDAGKRVPFADVLNLDYVPEDNPAWMLFITRQCDLMGVPTEVYRQVITATKELDEKMVSQGISLLKYTQPAVYWFTLNMEDRVLGKSKSLRQAMNLAFNVEDFIKVIRNGRGIRAVNCVPGSFDGHDQAGPGPYSHYDLDAARKKVADARKELVSAGVIGAGEAIPPLVLDLGGTDEITRRVGEFTQQQWKAIGLDIKVEPQDWPTLLDKMRKKQCQIYSSGWVADYPDAENFLQLFYSPNIKRGTNNSNYSNGEFDKLYEKVVLMQPSPERTALYVRMINMISEDCPMVFQSEPVSFLLYHKWVHNVKPHPVGYGFAKYRRIDVEARRQAGGR